MPRDNPSTPRHAEALLAALHAVITRRDGLQILLLGAPGEVAIYLRAPAALLPSIDRLIWGSYPDAEVHRAVPPLPTGSAPLALAAARWVLADDRVLPIRCVPTFATGDPMGALLAALAAAAASAAEIGIVSLAVSRAPASFARRAAAVQVPSLRELRPAPGAPAVRLPLSPEERARREAIARKASGPAFRVTLRTAWWAMDPAAARAGHVALAGALGQFAGRNQLLPQRAGRRRQVASYRGVVSGSVARRERCILGTEELSGLVHFPGADVVVPYLRRTGSRRREPRTPLAPGGFALAESNYRDRGEPVGLSAEQLCSHAYVVGPSGTGKTTMLARLVLALAASGTAGIVLDPHGDLVRQVLSRLPGGDAHRVALFDLADPQRLPVLNPLWLPPDPPEGLATARARRSAAVTSVFADLWGLHRTVTPNLLHFLHGALSALVGAGTGCLAALPRFLDDGAFRHQVIRACNDALVAETWTQFARMSYTDRSHTVRAILNKAGEFTRNPLLATVFGDSGPGLRLESFMDSGRVLLVSLPRGLVPEGTVELLGSLLVTVAHQEALAREARPPDERPPVIAVIDEFQEFALSAFAKVVTGARKYGLGLVVANQNLSRVRAVDPEVLETLLANVGTLTVFATAPGDAVRLAPFVAPLDAADLGTQAPFECTWRLPGPDGPQVVTARTRALGPPLRSEAETTTLAAALRLRGRPLVAPVPRPAWSGPDGLREGDDG
ncbi:MAG TPA: type IV secretion system DNA-binding domain-containing protein [Mycobacteriales bacterium]|nr:type IV secretion system DNA-binding domain-containing protein [Mycobacteriales bacterium]